MERLSLEFQEHTFHKLFERGHSRIVQLSLQEGQVIDKHQADRTLAFMVLSGQMRLTVNGEAVDLSAQELALVDPFTEHAVQALEKSTALLVLLPADEVASDCMATHVQHEPDHVCASTHTDVLANIAPELHSLVEDHRKVCVALEDIHLPFDIHRYNYMLDLIGTELGRHFVYEEEILFPRLAPYLGGADVGPIPRLLQEHRVIRELHQKAVSLSAGAGHGEAVARDLEQVMGELAHVLLNHIEKEDAHLFPMAGRLLSDEERAAVAREIVERERAD